MQCQQHPQLGEMKFIPAGTSRTSGKPYPAFWACKERTCKYKPPETSVNKFEKNLEQEQVQQRIDNRVAEKDDRIARSVALNDASLIIANLHQRMAVNYKAIHQEVLGLAQDLYEWLVKE